MNLIYEKEQQPNATRLSFGSDRHNPLGHMGPGPCPPLSPFNEHEPKDQTGQHVRWSDGICMNLIYEREKQPNATRLFFDPDKHNPLGHTGPGTCPPLSPINEHEQQDRHELMGVQYQHLFSKL